MFHKYIGLLKILTDDMLILYMVDLKWCNLFSFNSIIKFSYEFVKTKIIKALNVNK